LSGSLLSAGLIGGRAAWARAAEATRRTKIASNKNLANILPLLGGISCSFLTHSATQTQSQNILSAVTCSY